MSFEDYIDGRSEAYSNANSASQGTKELPVGKYQGEIYEAKIERQTFNDDFNRWYNTSLSGLDAGDAPLVEDAERLYFSKLKIDESGYDFQYGKGFKKLYGGTES